MARVVIIVNPMAARTSKKILARVEAAFVQEGWVVDVLETTGTGDAETKAREVCADDSLDVVAPYGGDGTMIEVVTGAHGTGKPVGILPGGTGNVLAGNLRLPRSPVDTARVITGGRERCIDLGRFQSADQKRFFSVACGSGFEARLMETTGAAKRKWGVGAYVAKGIKLAASLDNNLYSVTIDGKSVEVPAATLTIANCEEIVPPILSLHEGIKLDDGVLDVLAINARHFGHAALAVWGMLLGRGSRSKLVSHMRGSEIKVESEIPQPVGLDGEMVGPTPFTADVLPRALKVIVGQ